MNAIRIVISLVCLSLATVVRSFAYTVGTNVQGAAALRPIRMVATDKAAEDTELFRKYCEDVQRAVRRKTSTVWAGKVGIGSDHPIRLQTMTTTDTRNVEKSVEQVLRIADSGADLVRLTVQGKPEAKACMEIRERLFQLGCDIPLVADIHFQPAVAMAVADAFEKIRINPGNFVDGRKSFENMVYDSEEEYRVGLRDIEERFTPLVLKCKELGRAMRIGTNHGSLSARVMSYWGDTPVGMVQSALEFANICRNNDYHNFLFSMKASNPLVMVQAYRLLVAEMEKRDWHYPLHLGVTEAGEGEDGRMKSAIGIGALLLDGLGDTIRVSLTEDPELELKPCGTLAAIGKHFSSDASLYQLIPAFKETKRSITNFERRKGVLPHSFTAAENRFDYQHALHRDGSVVSVVASKDLTFSPSYTPEKLYSALGCKLAVGMPFKDLATSDSILIDGPIPADVQARQALKRLMGGSVGVFAEIQHLKQTPFEDVIPVFSLEQLAKGDSSLPTGAHRRAVRITGLEQEEMFTALNRFEDIICAFIDAPTSTSSMHAGRRAFEMLHRVSSSLPAIISLRYKSNASGSLDRDEVVLRAGAEGGGLLVDGLGDGVLLHADAPFDVKELRLTSFNMLQGCRMRNTKTDFVSCPSCGRTLFDLQEVTAQIQSRTGHLPGVSIAIMGCIVNGPGEMADADFGYVGGAPGKIDLYLGKEVIRRHIPNEGACDELIEIIKQHGLWVDPPVEANA